MLARIIGFILFGALTAGAAGPNDSAKGATAQEPVLTSIFNTSQLQEVPIESVDSTPSYGSEGPPAKAAAQCAGIVVTATELLFSDGFESGDTNPWGPEALPQFSAIRMLDLDLTVLFVDGFNGDHLLHLRLFTPKGHHYQTLSVGIASASASRKSMRLIEGYPRPVAVRLLNEAGSSSLPEVTLSVPVGGTPIGVSSLYGMWTAEAYLDEQSEACASQPFVLTP